MESRTWDWKKAIPEDWTQQPLIYGSFNRIYHTLISPGLDVKTDAFKLLLDNKYFALQEPFSQFADEIGGTPKTLTFPNSVTLNSKQYNVHSCEKQILELAQTQFNWSEAQKAVFWFKKFIFNAKEHSHQWLKEFTKDEPNILDNDFKRQICQLFMEFYYQEKVNFFNLLTTVILISKNESHSLNSLALDFVNKHFKQEPTTSSQVIKMIDLCMDHLTSISNIKYYYYHILGEYSLLQESIILFIVTLVSSPKSFDPKLLSSFTDWLVNDKKQEINNGINTGNGNNYSIQRLETVKSLVFLRLLDLDEMLIDLHENHSNAAHFLAKKPQLIDTITEKVCFLSEFEDYALVSAVWGLVVKTCFKTIFKQKHMVKYQTPVANSLNALLDAINEEYDMEDVLSLLNLNLSFQQYQKYIEIVNNTINPLGVHVYLKDLSNFILYFLDNYPASATEYEIVNAFCAIVGASAQVAQDIWSSINPGKSVILDTAIRAFPYDLSTYLKISTTFIELLPQNALINELNSVSTLTLSIPESLQSYMKHNENPDTYQTDVSTYVEIDIPFTHWKIPLGSSGIILKDVHTSLENSNLVQFNYEFSVFDYLLNVLDYLSRTEYTSNSSSNIQQSISTENIVVALKYILDGLPHFCLDFISEPQEQHHSSSKHAKSPYLILNLALQIINYSTNNQSKFNNESIACCLQILTELIPRYSDEAWELIHKYGLLRHDTVLANYFLHLGNSPSEMIYSKIKEEIILGDYNVTIGFLDLINTLNQSIAHRLYLGSSDINKSQLEDMKNCIKFIYSSIFSCHLFWKYNSSENRIRIGTLCMSIFSLCFDLNMKLTDAIKKFNNISQYLSFTTDLFVNDTRSTIIPLMDLIDQYQIHLNEERSTGFSPLFDNAMDCVDHLETILSFFSRLVQYQLVIKDSQSNQSLVAVFMNHSVGNRAFIDILAKFIDANISPVTISSTIILLTQLLLSGCNSNTFLHSFTSDVNSTLVQFTHILQIGQFDEFVQSQLWNLISTAIKINPGFANLILFGESYLEGLNDTNLQSKSTSSQTIIKPSPNSIINCLKDSLDNIENPESVTINIQKSLLQLLSSIWTQKTHFNEVCKVLSSGDYIWKILNKYYTRSKNQSDHFEAFVYQSDSFFYNILCHEIQSTLNSESASNQPSLEFIGLVKLVLKENAERISEPIDKFSDNDPFDDIQLITSYLKNYFHINNLNFLEKRYLSSNLDPYRIFGSDYLYSIDFMIQVISYNLSYITPNQQEIISVIQDLVENVNHASLLKKSISMCIDTFSELLTLASQNSDEKLWPSSKDKNSLNSTYLQNISESLYQSNSTSKFARDSVEYSDLIMKMQKISSTVSIKSSNESIGTSTTNDTAEVLKLVKTLAHLSLLTSPTDLIQALSSDVNTFMGSLSCYYQLAKSLESIFNIFNRNSIDLPKGSLELSQFETACIDMIHSQVKIIDLLINLSIQDAYIETHQTIATILTCLKSLFNYPRCPSPGLWINFFEQTKVLENITDWLLYCYRNTDPNMSAFPLVTLDFLLSLASIPTPLRCLEKIGVISKFTLHNYSYYPGISENNHIVWHRILEFAHCMFEHFTDSNEFQRQITEFIKIYWTHFVGLLNSLAREDLNLSFNLLVETGLVLRLFATFSHSYWMVDLLRQSPEISFSISSLLSRLVYFLLHPLDTQSRFTNISYKEHMEILKYVELPTSKDASNSVEITDTIFQSTLSFRLECVVRQLIQNSLHFLLNVDGVSPHNLTNLFTSNKTSFRILMEPKILNHPGDQSTLGTILDMLNHEETSFNETIKMIQSKNIFKRQNVMVILNNLNFALILLISQISLNFHNAQGDELKNSGLAQIISETNSVLNKLGVKLDELTAPSKPKLDNQFESKVLQVKNVITELKNLS